MKESFKNRALENIRATEVLFEQGFYNASSNRAYYVLHLQGYYECEKGIKVIEAGFDYGKSIVSALKPNSKNGVSL
jgi:hypothetical protein